MIIDVHAHYLPELLVEQLGIPDAERAAILGGTAQGVFRLRPDCAC